MSHGLGKIISIDTEETTHEGRRMSTRKNRVRHQYTRRIKATHLERGVRAQGI